MSKILHQARRHAPALAAFVIALGFIAEAHGYPPQRRRGMSVPQQPVNVDSSPIIDDINKALRALDATDRGYDGHRDKAISHLHSAIADLGIPNAKGKTNTNAAASKNTGKVVAETPSDKASSKNPTTSQADSDAAISKAKKVLFSLYHDLEGAKASTKGQIHARAEVKIAIDELTAAQKVASAAAAPAAATAPAAAAAAAKPGK